MNQDGQRVASAVVTGRAQQVFRTASAEVVNAERLLRRAGVRGVRVAVVHRQRAMFSGLALRCDAADTGEVTPSAPGAVAVDAFAPAPDPRAQRPADRR
ncbi:hypothetical protein [Umezawaea beigongshangensis]|uniref:hypothetical protein n=1 Tax=Umezawaea beigongshangensis TaxID=2780383 RepID=UPI0018F11264|nr:hypothetical protein [Umezawaea beigongshangensis]